MRYTRKYYIDKLTNEREFQLTSGKWVSGGIDHYKLAWLKELHAGSRKKR